jgi:hypothetical protein
MLASIVDGPAWPSFLAWHLGEAIKPEFPEPTFYDEVHAWLARWLAPDVSQAARQVQH